MKIYTPSGTKSNKIVDLLNHQQPQPYLTQTLKKRGVTFTSLSKLGMVVKKSWVMSGQMGGQIAKKQNLFWSFKSPRTTEKWINGTNFYSIEIEIKIKSLFKVKVLNHFWAWTNYQIVTCSNMRESAQIKAK